MHELSVCQALIGQVETIARRESAARVTAIHLAIGPLSGIEPELLRRAWPLAAGATIAEEAELLIEAADIRVECSVCGAESAAKANRLLCGECGDWRTRLVSGDEMLLTRLELERTGGVQQEDTGATTEDSRHV
ncbi:hydrogenase maturation nickel metallochaperone HypA/HybF [Lentisalinibacter sediminis]|uniref:hydrogenase maturation nickel metallochaperone HypA/HybF n=1 Tax=Lentisalinibacter sediminis TaxID=2992237 RepID=UPI00386BDC78